MRRFAAAIMFFTRLPLWKWVAVDKANYERIVELWPFVGWITGSLTALSFFTVSQVLPTWCALSFAFMLRTLLTGGLHEDGLADFFDGFGAGGSRERILSIMKDSHIGTYGVLSLIFYYSLLISSLCSLSAFSICFLILAGDIWAKFCASQIINFLPYARKAEEAKSKLVYQRTPLIWIAIGFIFSIVPAIWLPHRMLWAYVAAALMMALLIVYLKKKISGYTGDCCGATFLICELTFYLVAIACN